MFTPGPTIGHGAVRTARGFVFHAAVFLLAFLLFGVAQESLLLPVVGWVTVDHADPEFVHDIAFAALVLVAFLGALAQFSRPRERVALVQVTAVAVCGLAGLAVYTGGAPTATVLAALALVAVVAHPAERARRPRVGAVDRRAGGLVVLLSPPLLTYAVVQAGGQLGRTGEHAALGHWGGMALVALVTLVAAALGSGSTPGRDAAALVASGLVATVGLASLLSASPSSVGPVWGALAVGWAVAFAGRVVTRRRAATPVEYHFR